MYYFALFMHTYSVVPGEGMVSNVCLGRSTHVLCLLALRMHRTLCPLDVTCLGCLCEFDSYHNWPVFHLFLLCQPFPETLLAQLLYFLAG